MLLAYVFPFVFLSSSTWQDIVAYALFALLLIAVILRTDLWMLNPLLLLSGYRILSVRTSQGGDAILVTRRQVHDGDVVQAVTLSSGAMKEKPESEEGTQ